MKKFKKLAAAVLCSLLVAALLPGAAFADDVTFSDLDGVTWSGSSDGASYSNNVLTISGDGTLTISSNVTIAGGISVTSGTVTIVVGDNCTLTSTSGHTVSISSGADVTLRGGTYKCTANDTSNASKAVVYNLGTCTIESGTYYNESSNEKAYYTIQNEGTMTIENGTFTGDAGSSGSTLVRNSKNGDYATLTINGGTFGRSSDEYGSSGNKIAIGNDETGTVTIYGGTFYGTNQSVQNWGTCTIYGGTFNSVVAGWGWESETTKYESILTIYDGTFSSEVVAYYQYRSGWTVDTEIIIYGGTYEDDVYEYNYYEGKKEDGDDCDITIYHGDFSTDVSSYLATSATVTDSDGDEVSAIVVSISETDEDGNETTTVHALVKVEAVEATCTEDGNIEYYYCAYDCDSPYFTAETTTDEDGNETTTYTSISEGDWVVEATGHSYVVEVTEATCTEDGVVTYTCSACGDTYTETIAATGHNYESEVTTEATCTEDGVITYTCTVCGDTYTEAIAAGHSWDYENYVAVWASDYSSVSVTWTCTVCGATYTNSGNVDDSMTVEYDDGTIGYTAWVKGPDGDLWCIYTEVTPGESEESETSEESEETEGSETSETSVETDDTSNLALWFALAAAAVVVGAAGRKKITK